ncbi:MAG: hypothetical protein WCS85_00745 [Candidatus Peribacteraceae bacterium]|jgi:uncharacterized protein YjeT (DUF2065 family)
MQQILFFLSDDPMLRMAQAGLVFAGVLAVYLVCFATRDILLRTHSFLYQALSILLVACLPGIGFFVYLLIRPARTVKEREMEKTLRRVATLLEESEILSTEEPVSEPKTVPASTPPESGVASAS